MGWTRPTNKKQAPFLQRPPFRVLLGDPGQEALLLQFEGTPFSFNHHKGDAFLQSPCSHHLLELYIFPQKRELKRQVTLVTRDTGEKPERDQVLRPPRMLGTRLGQEERTPTAGSQRSHAEPGLDLPLPSPSSAAPGKLPEGGTCLGAWGLIQGKKGQEEGFETGAPLCSLSKQKNKRTHQNKTKTTLHFINDRIQRFRKKCLF